MSALQPGVAVDDWAARADRFAMSNGLRRDKGNDSVRLAQTPWRPATPRESHCLQGPSTGNAESIRILPVPAWVTERAGRLRLAAVCDQKAVTRIAIADSVEFGELFARLREFGQSLLESAEGFYCQSVRAERTGLESVTFDEVAGHYIGLHVDDWDRLPAIERHHARRRLMLNLGAEPRYFVFLNLAVTDLLSCENPGSGDEAFAPVLDFVDRHPGYPIVRLALHPGEALVAPVQNLLHDGTTAGKRCTDVSVSMLGFFR